MNSASRQWIWAPSILGVMWVGLFASADYDSTTQTWWQLFVLTPERSLLCAVTTPFFHANLSHLLGNLGFAYALTFSFNGMLRPIQVLGVWLVLAPLATLISFIANPSPLVGASAGLTGVLGCALKVALDHDAKPLKTRSIVAIVAVLVCLAPGDQIAHVSGLCLGYVFGLRLLHAEYMPRVAGFSLLIVCLYLVWATQVT